jgi:hypothetical protein
MRRFSGGRWVEGVWTNARQNGFENFGFICGRIEDRKIGQPEDRFATLTG